MWRAGFGPSALQLEQRKTTDTIRLFESLLNASSVQPAFLDATDDYLKGLMNGLEEEGLKKNTMDNDERKNFQQQTRQAIKDLNILWLEQMIQSPAQLREKMAFFWHGHFASRNLNVFFQQQLLDVIRKHALGSLRDLYGSD